MKSLILVVSLLSSTAFANEQLECQKNDEQHTKLTVSRTKISYGPYGNRNAVDANCVFSPYYPGVFRCWYWSYYIESKLLQETWTGLNETHQETFIHIDTNNARGRLGLPSGKIFKPEECKIVTNGW